MRPKLTAKHPRPASPGRDPVRSGSHTGRKPVRAAPGAESPTGKPAAKSAAPRTSKKPAGAPRERAAFGQPPARGGRERPDTGRPARPSAGGDRFGTRDASERSTRPARASAPGTARPNPEGRKGGFAKRPEAGGDRFGTRDASERSTRPPRASAPGTARQNPEGRKGGFAKRPEAGADRFGTRDASERSTRPARAFAPGAARQNAEGRTGGFAKRPEAAGERAARPRSAFGESPARGRERPDAGRPARPSADNDRFGPRGDARKPRRDDGSPAPKRSDASFKRDDASFKRGDFKRSDVATKRGDAPAKRGDFAARRDTGPSAARRPTGGALKVAQPVKRFAASEDRDETGLMRLSKRMSELGLCSRREADEWIEKGWVLVDGERIDTLGTKVRADQRIEIDERAAAAQAAQVTILLHKPVGYVSGQAEDGYEPAAVLITRDNHWSGDHSPLRFSPQHLRALAPAGRLDIDSTGLLVLTQNGRIAKQLIGEQSDIDKEYLVRVRFGERLTDIDQHFPAESLAKLRHGLELDGVPLKPAMVSWQNGEQLRFVLREGKKRQIRRMCELVGLEVIGLKRVRMGRVMLGALPQGQWRYLSADENF
ncbi:pseudouridine synthase Rsu [Burkholderia sp. lig30]|jgi:23S rRNA pseudouridine2604 synthase|uniref:pseudouridine synthase n=1 Tax=Burkholderia sp. lig30 TaxID=1192124 RepID=UPI00046139D3|nr:pseudouridine synthase [Burkholderia sp. lig30]KDB07651.1 pseudouridine synthase Rsu [Burkholderia sp. lig30]